MKRFDLINQSVPLFKFKHDVEQAQYLISKDYDLEYIRRHVDKLTS